MRKAITALALVAGVLAVGASVSAQEPGESGQDRMSMPDKAWVCKFVGQPGVDEVLKDGKNPIEVSVNAIPGDAVVGAEFSDAQGRSVVVQIGGDDPGSESCGTTPVAPDEVVDVDEPMTPDEVVDVDEPMTPDEVIDVDESMTPDEVVDVDESMTPDEVIDVDESMTPEIDAAANVGPAEAAAPQSLPETGTETTVIAVLAALMTALGGTALLAARNRSALIES